MCGITGILDKNGGLVEQSVVKKMTDSISHRGPDGEGQYVSRNVGLGHRRLAIIDVSKAGQQPMLSTNKSCVITYNGEIYNYKELRKELQEKGFEFETETDTEVVLKSIEFWGENALRKFNGMFALAFLDLRTNTLLLARDRYGIKPLYYSDQNSYLIFASEQKAILEFPNFKRELNRPALYEYFTFQNLFTCQTLIKNVELLPAGHYLKIDIRENCSKICKYWDYNFVSGESKSAKITDYQEELRRLFFQAVHRQLASDVEVGAYLSGGMDSGSIVSVASQFIPQLKTFTVGFDLSSASGIELAFDERTRARLMSSFFETSHHEMELKAGDMERCLPDLAWHLEEPRVGQSYPNYYAARLAGKSAKVVLSGTGGDELFGGYPWRYYRAANSLNFDDFIDKYYKYWQRLASNTELKKIFNPIWSDVRHVWTRDIFRDVFSNYEAELSTPEDFVNHSLYFEAKTFLHGLFLVEDKLSMAHSLESRVPFLDNEIVDFAMQCPLNLKLKNLSETVRLNENDVQKKYSKNFDKSSKGKQILRSAMSTFVPEEIIFAEKQGFSSPDASWFKGESINFVKGLLSDKEAKIFEYLDRDAVSEIVGRHISGKENRRLFIWSILNVNSWMAQYL